MLFSFCIPSSATNYTNLLNPNLSDVSWQELDLNGGFLANTYQPSTKNNIIVLQASSTSLRVVTFLSKESFRAEHEYQLNFQYCSNWQDYSLYVSLYLYDANGNVVQTKDLQSNIVNYNTTLTYKSYSFNFIPNNVFTLDVGYSLAVVFNFVAPTPNTAQGGTYYLKNISMYDLDETIATDTSATTGFWTSVTHWLSALYHSIVGGMDLDNVNHLSLWSQIVDGINAKLDIVKTAINDKLDTVKIAINAQIAQIKEDVRSLFVPSNTYFNDKKIELDNFCTLHFGALYQIPDTMIDFITKLTTMSPSAPSITMPGMDLKWQGSVIHLTDDVVYSFAWVNDSSNALYYFYKVYRGFVTVIMFLSFGNYCINKFHEIFGGGGVTDDN